MEATDERDMGRAGGGGINCKRRAITAPIDQVTFDIGKAAVAQELPGEVIPGSVGYQDQDALIQAGPLLVESRSFTLHRGALGASARRTLGRSFLEYTVWLGLAQTVKRRWL